MIAKIIISLAIIFIILGALISAITAIGIIRLKDVYSRGHAAGTGPLSSHLMMKASYNNKTPYTKDTKIDELKDEFNNKKI